jgi:hypothetical protein
MQGVQGQLDVVQIIFNQEYFYVLSYHAAPLSKELLHDAT